MKVYELIRELAKHDPNCDVQANFRMSVTADCPHCNKSHDETFEDLTSVDSVVYDTDREKLTINISY